MGFKFEKPGRKKAADQAVLTADQKAYRDREKQEEERYKLAVDSRFWICFCFHDAEERAKFVELSQADEEFFCFGDILRDVFTDKIGIQNKRQFKPKVPVGDPAPDPFEGLEPTESLEADCLAEADAILAAWDAMGIKDRYDNIWDSAYYVTAVFRDSNDTEQFIREFALAKYGDLYMDGSKILELLT